MTLTAAGFIMMFMSAQAAPPVPADVDAGQALFEGKGRCLTCHRIEETGARTARDLSWIGLLRTPEKLRASVTNPATHPAASTLATSEIDSLVAYLRTRRKLW